MGARILIHTTEAWRCAHLSSDGIVAVFLQVRYNVPVKDDIHTLIRPSSSANTTTMYTHMRSKTTPSGVHRGCSNGCSERLQQRGPN